MRALITGITVQGFFLSQFLLLKGYEVYGIARGNLTKMPKTLDLWSENLKNQIHIYYGYITDTNFINEVVSELKSNELYHLVAQNFVVYSFTNPSYTYDVNIGSTLNVENAVKNHSKDTKLYF
ncbi:GDP-mannose 4,6-dehydratase [Metallosphaera sp.]|uniref:GDP-mannose 4,6-dehydratase n=1 Tax=Metallosphaera sp. TaxID=2020860 RepID=UPI0031750776